MYAYTRIDGGKLDVGQWVAIEHELSIFIGITIYIKCRYDNVHRSTVHSTIGRDFG